MLLPASIHANDELEIPFPSAGTDKVFQIYNDADSVRKLKDDTIGGTNVQNMLGSTKAKDLKADVKLLGYLSGIANDEAESEVVIDLTGEDSDVKLAVLADDVAEIEVSKNLVNDKFGAALKLTVSGGALWNPASYKESEFTLSRGSKYKIKLHYKNKFHWSDGKENDVDGVSVFCYKAPDLVLKTYDTETDNNWQDPKFNADAESKSTGGDVYLKAQDNNPEKGEEIKLRVQLREKFKNLNEAAYRFGKLTLRTYGKDGWKVPTSAKPLRTMEVDLLEMNIATLVGPQNDELRIRIPYEKVYKELVNDKDQAEGDAQESFSTDEVTPGGGSVEDSVMFDEMLAEAGAKWRGSLRRIWKGTPPVEQPIKLPVMPNEPRLVKAAGTVFLQAAFEKQKVNSINNALLQNQADIIYASSHCETVDFCSALSLASLPSAKLKNYWDQDVDVIIISACYNLRVADLDNIDKIYSGKNYTITGGLDWLKNMPKAKVLLGYRFKAPSDIIRYRNVDYEVSKSIIGEFLKTTKGCKDDAKKLAEAWLVANKNNAKSYNVGNSDNELGNEQRPYNACAIDVKLRKYYYWHHETWDGKGNPPVYTEVSIQP